MKKYFFALAALAAVGITNAQPVGAWLIQGGLTHIAPDVTSGDLSAPAPKGTQVDVGSDTQATAQVTYVLTPQWSLALPLGTGFTHKIYGAGGISGTGQIGSVKALPVSLFAQYRFGQSDDKLRPYVMLGLSYAHFSNARGSAALSAMNPSNPVGGSTGLSVASRFALSPGLGASMQLNETWFVDAWVAKSLLKTTNTLSTGQTIDVRLNPTIVSFGVGKRF